MAEFMDVARVDEVPPGGMRRVVVGGRSLAVYNVDGTFFATDNTCLHRGGSLADGDLEGPLVTCPLHGWTYDVRTGANRLNALARLPTFEVRVEGGVVKVRV